MNNSSGRLYKIISFEHAVQIFEKGEIHFSHPSTWDDPYETRLSHRYSKKIYAQCWCSKGASDAMWRIYSPNHLGVRIGTSTKLLRDALKPEANKLGMKLRLGDVTYHTQSEINQEATKIREDLAEKFILQRATDLMYMKRDAYDHEFEYRAVLYFPEAAEEDVVKGLKIKVKAKKLIDSILIDPRAPDELAQALIY
ncbi:MAG: DUF2971 domain-containing protein, partial [Pseudohongiella sp.]|nr:DUF2971 domain-containing protein [Pseudohongiella sp.]